MLTQEKLAAKLHSRITLRKAQIRSFEGTRKIASSINKAVGNQIYVDVIEPLSNDQYLDRKLLKLLQRSNAAGFLL